MNRNLTGLVALAVTALALLLTQEGGSIARLIGVVPIGGVQPASVVELAEQALPSSELAVGSASTETGSVVYEEADGFTDFDEESENSDEFEQLDDEESELAEPSSDE